MRHRLAVFSALFVLVLGLEYLFLEPPFEYFIIPVPWEWLQTAAFLAWGVTWFWLRLRSTP